MDPTVVKRVKLVWAAAGVVGTVVTLVGWGVPAAAAAALAYLGVTVLAFVGCVVYVLMWEAPVVWRVVVIAVVLTGLVVEAGALVTVLGWLVRSVLG